MSRSELLFTQSQHYIPGGVNSPVRAFKGVGGTPIYFVEGDGAYIVDVDQKRYIDYVGSWGPMIVGHSHPEVIASVQSIAASGLGFGAPTEIELNMAKKLCALMPSMEQVRMVSSGTEATMSAIRLARGFTGREKIIKFVGCYHGHVDSLLVEAGSGALTLGIPSSPGISKAVAEQTICVPYNDIALLENTFATLGDDIAAVIVEPVAGNMNCIPPVDGFLAGLRRICDQYESLLIFDEVMTGFRVALGGAQSYFGVVPDLTTLGKIIGGGLPVGAFGGRRDVMQYLAPVGPVYQAGTLSGNPVALTAGLTTLNVISDSGFYQQLADMTQQLCLGLEERAKQAGIKLITQQVGGMFGYFFTDQLVVTNYQEVAVCNIEQFKQFFHGMLAEGVYFAPSAFEASFLSLAHTDNVINQTLSSAEKVFKNL